MGLNFAGREIGSFPVFLGAKFETDFRLLGDVDLSTWLRVSWRHELDDNRSIEAAFLAAPGFDFIVEGARVARDAAQINAGLKLDVTKEAALFAVFNGDFASREQDYSGLGGIRISW